MLTRTLTLMRILTLLSVALIDATAPWSSRSSSVVPAFRPVALRRFTNGTNFTSLVLAGDSLYVGGRDALYRLSAANIGDTSLASLLALPTRGEQREQCIATYYDERLCRNFVKSLLHRPQQRDLYVCSTYAFSPRLYQLSYDLRVLADEDGYGFCSLNPLDTSTLVWVESGNPGGLPSVYAGSILDASTQTLPTEPVIYRPELKAAAAAAAASSQSASASKQAQSANGGASTITFPYLRTTKYDPDWLYQVAFVQSFDVDDYVFFFLREKSLEQVAESQDVTYSRVVRLCKSDTGSSASGSSGGGGGGGGGGSESARNKWTSMRKARLACVYNNTYLNELEDVIRVDDDLFVGLFTLRLPEGRAASFLCQFSKRDILSVLNAPATNFKERVAGTQYWYRVPGDRVPVGLPNQCNYDSSELRSEAVDFLKTHCLIGDLVEATLVQYVDKQALSVAVDTLTLPTTGSQSQYASDQQQQQQQSDTFKKSNMNGGGAAAGQKPPTRVYYVGTADGSVVKIVSKQPASANDDDNDSSTTSTPMTTSASIVSVWKVADEPIGELRVQPGRSLFAATDSGVYQVQLRAQCGQHALCSTCMRDPYCGWSVRRSACQDAATSSVVAGNAELCARFQRHDSIRAMQVESGSFVQLECRMRSTSRTAAAAAASDNSEGVATAAALDDDDHDSSDRADADDFLRELIEWRRDQQPLDLERGGSSSSLLGGAMFLTWKRDLVILAGNSSMDGMYTCHADKSELMSSYSLTFVGSTKTRRDETPSATAAAAASLGGSAESSESSSGSSSSSHNGQKCITAESYIRQYNNWCDEYSRYHRALTEWEDLKDKSCSSAAGSAAQAAGAHSAAASGRT